MSDSKRKASANAYLTFLTLKDNLSAKTRLELLDPLEERIFCAVALASHLSTRLSVTDLLARHDLASPSTIQVRIEMMRRKGWIMLAETEDSRRKQVELTPVALLYLDKIGNILVQALADSFAAPNVRPTQAIVSR